MHCHFGDHIELCLVNNLHVGLDEVSDSLDLALERRVTVLIQFIVLVKKRRRNTGKTGCAKEN